MKETGILFTPDNIRAIREDRKTQTRRIVKLPSWGTDDPRDVEYSEDSVQMICANTGCMGDILCPYGVPGDRLYVKEGWGIGGARLIDPTVNYRAGGQMPLIGHASPDTWSIHGNRHEVNDADLLAVKDGWHNAMFMPKWAARLWLEITDVRVQRVQDISEEDAIAEGVESPDTERDVQDWKICPRCGGTRLYEYQSMAGACPDTDCTKCDTNAKRYRYLWDSINHKKHPWASSPWVWALTFKIL